MAMRRPRNSGFAAAFHALAAGAVLVFFRIVRCINRNWLGKFTAWVLRNVGPWLPEHKIGRANLVAAFPDKPPGEIDRILRGVWGNIGWVVAEFSHIDRLHIVDPARPGTEDIVYDPDTLERFHRLRVDGKPALVFAAHLANWEVPALVACDYELDSTVLYRRPSSGAVADVLLKIRSGRMGTLVPTGIDAPAKLSNALVAGSHVAMLVDQFYTGGVTVDFFGRPARTNPLIARLARLHECPIHGTRAIRLPDQRRFKVEITDEIAPARDAEGKIDVQGTMQIITGVIEGWVREHPEQWLWLHRRWRDY